MRIHVSCAETLPADGETRESVLEKDGITALMLYLNECYGIGGTEFRLSVLQPGHAILHRLGSNSKTFDIFWEE